MPEGAPGTPQGTPPGGAGDGTGAGGSGGGTPPAGGEPQPHWADALPEDIRAHEGLRAFDSIESFARGHIDLAGKVPKVPESPDQYTITIPDGVTKHDGFIQAMRGSAHKLGLSQEQLQGLADGYHGFVQGELTEGAKVLDAENGKLKTEWGNDYAKNLELANRALSKFGGEPVVNYLKALSLDSDPMLLRAFAAVGRAIGESEWAAGGGGGGDTRPTDQAGQPMLRFNMGNK